jgi:uncharacterized lipoprotein YddW (UPF0748 family)
MQAVSFFKRFAVGVGFPKGAENGSGRLTAAPQSGYNSRSTKGVSCMPHLFSSGRLSAFPSRFSVLPAGLFGLCALLCAPSVGGAQSVPDLTRNISAVLGTQGRLMWIDGTANVFHKVMVNGVEQTVDYTTTREGVAEIVRHCKAAHVNTLVVDVKPLSGEVLYNSSIAPHMRSWKGRPVPDFDVLKAFVEEGHKAGLRVAADINTLSEGHKFYNIGPAYQHPQWQSIVYTVDRGLVAPDGTRLAVHCAGEPGDAAKPTVLNDTGTILGGEPTSGMVGLESTESADGVLSGTAGTPVGKQLNVALDADNRVVGMVDSALLGDDPLVSPEDGHLITVTRDADRDWVSRHLKTGEMTHFDLHTGLTPIAQAPSEKVACFVNPLYPDVRQYVLNIVREIVSKYDIDGLVLDRCRFSNLYNDFSDLSRDTFARRLGKPIAHWPQDVFSFSQEPGEGIVRGPLYRPWLEFRAQVIRDLVGDIARTARSIKPGISFGTYVGSWYPSYYEVGVNWGSERTRLRYSWFTPDYPRTGYADFFDWISTGCYYPTATREDARRQGSSEKGTVEYAAELSNNAVAGAAFVYAGIYVPDYADRPDALLKALNAAAQQGQGWMIFDLSYIDAYNFWPVLERASTADVKPPHADPELLSAVRAAQDGAW